MRSSLHSHLAPSSLDFAPGLLAIQESPPARMPRAVLLTVCLLFSLLLIWSWLGQLDIIASAEGRLVPRTYLKIVQPADAGIVQDILVSEGQNVTAGQVLLRLDTQMADADTATLRNELAWRALQLRRIASELGERPLHRQTKDPADLYTLTQSQLLARREVYLNALAQTREALTKAEHDLDVAQQILRKLQKSAPLLQQQAQAYADLGRDGFVAPVLVWEKERDYQEKAQDLKAQHAVIAGLIAAVAQARRQHEAVGSRYRSELRNERMEAQAQFDRLEQDWAKQSHKAALLVLRAPEDGVVKDIATHTRGTVVAPGTVLLSLVPRSEPLMAQVRIRNEDVGFIHPDQRVRLKFAAYPFQKYGMVDGTVSHIGPDASDADAMGAADGGRHGDAATAAFYKATVTLATQNLAQADHPLKLVAGMQLVAEIELGQRSVLEYLLSPIQQAFQESARER